LECCGLMGIYDFWANLRKIRFLEKFKVGQINWNAYTMPKTWKRTSSNIWEDLKHYSLQLSLYTGKLVGMKLVPSISFWRCKDYRELKIGWLMTNLRIYLHTGVWMDTRGITQYHLSSMNHQQLIRFHIPSRCSNLVQLNAMKNY